MKSRALGGASWRSNNADLWKDLGTWNTLTEEMPEKSIGDVTWDDTCENSHAINVLGIPMVVMGAKKYGHCSFP